MVVVVALRPVAVGGVGRVPRNAGAVAAGVGTIVVDGATCDSRGVTRRASSSAVLDGARAGGGTSGVGVDIACIAVGVVCVREAFSSSILILVPVSTQSTLERQMFSLQYSL